MGSRALVIRDSAFREDKDHGEIEDYLKQAGVDCLFYDELRIGNTSSCIEGAVKMIKASYCDLIIGVGGVITQSFARFIAFTGGDAAVGMSVENLQPKKSLPYLCIPSTDRNPFLFKDFVMLTGGRERNLQFVKIARPPMDALFINPAFTSSSTTQYTIASLLEMLFNALETYFIPGNPLFVTSMLYGVIDQIYTMLDSAYHFPEGLEQQNRISEAGFLISLALGQSSLGAASLFTYTLDGMVSSPRSILASQLLPYVVEYGGLRSPERLKKIALLFGEDIYLQSLEQTTDGVAATLRRMTSRFEIPQHIRDLEIPLDKVLKAVDSLEQGHLGEAEGGVVTSEDLRNIITKIY